MIVDQNALQSKRLGILDELQLAETGKLNLEDPVAKYWPEFKVSGKEEITVRDLLTHYSGLRPSLDLNPNWSGYVTALRMIEEEKASVASDATSADKEKSEELVEVIKGETLKEKEEKRTKPVRKKTYKSGAPKSE